MGRLINSPFPGMDPYLESPFLWDDVRIRLLAILSDILQHGLVTRGYISRLDFTEVAHDLPKDRFLKIIEIKTRASVTFIEVVSPWNKTDDRLRAAYLERRRRCLASGVNVVEIDLWRGGKALVLLPPSATSVLEEDATIVNILRAGEFREEYHLLGLRKPLPQVPIPLKPGKPDVTLDLQDALDRAYVSAAYQDEIDYGRPPVPPLSPENAEWAQALLSTTFGPPPAG